MASARSAPWPDALQTGHFTTAEAARAGVSAGQLHRSSGLRLGRGLHLGPVASGTYAERAAAWLSVLPRGSALCAESAVYALTSVCLDDLRTVHVLVPATTSRPHSRPGLCLHQQRTDRPRRSVEGLRVVTPAEAWMGVGHHQRDAVVVAGDALLGHRCSTLAELDDAVMSQPGRRGVQMLRQCLPLLRARVDSPAETVVRLAMHDHGLPEPEVNPDLTDDAGGWLGRPDLALRSVRLAIQYDGDVHRVDRRRWRQDVARDEVLRDHGWDVIRVTGADLHDLTGLCDRIRHRIRRQAARLGVRSPL